MSDLWSALKSYLYGIGWLVIVVQFLPIAVRTVLRLVPVDARQEIEKQNLAFALLAGLFLLGLSFGVFYFVAHVS